MISLYSQKASNQVYREGTATQI